MVKENESLSNDLPGIITGNVKEGAELTGGGWGA